MNELLDLCIAPKKIKREQGKNYSKRRAFIIVVIVRVSSIKNKINCLLILDRVVLSRTNIKLLLHVVAP